MFCSQDVSALMRDDGHAMEQYMYAIGLLQLYGERPAAAATSRAAAASAVANQFATYLRQMEKFESLAVNDSEHNQTIVAKMRETKAEAEKLGKKRALEASEDMLTALMQRPTRRRHVGMAAAAVVYSAWTQSPVDATAAAFLTRGGYPAREPPPLLVGTGGKRQFGLFRSVLAAEERSE